jgi:MFS family permease
VFFGWRVVAAAFLIAVFAWGLGFYGPSVYVHELVRTRGWPVATVSGAVTVHFLFSALLILYLADAHERFGLAAVTRAGIVAFALGVLGWSHAAEPWQVYVAALLTGAGWAATSGAAVNAFVAPWFVADRARALSHAYNGASIGGVVFTPVWVLLIDRLGFAGATVLVSSLLVLVLWPLIGRVLGATPLQRGVNTDGAAFAVAAPNADVAPSSRRDLLGDWQFMSLSVAFSIGIFAQMGLITHMVLRVAPVLGDFGGAFALSLATFAAIVGRMTAARLAGVMSRRVIAAGNFLVQACGSLLLVAGASAPALLAGCVLFGLGIGNLLSLPPLILQAERPAGDVARALGLLTAINQMLYAFAPGAFGLMRDATGSYVLPFFIALAAQLASAAVVLSASLPPGRDRGY